MAAACEIGEGEARDTSRGEACDTSREEARDMPQGEEARDTPRGAGTRDTPRGEEVRDTPRVRRWSNLRLPMRPPRRFPFAPPRSEAVGRGRRGNWGWCFLRCRLKCGMSLQGLCDLRRSWRSVAGVVGLWSRKRGLWSKPVVGESGCFRSLHWRLRLPGRELAIA